MPLAIQQPEVVPTSITPSSPPVVSDEKPVDVLPLDAEATVQAETPKVPVVMVPEDTIKAPPMVPKVFITGTQLVKVDEVFSVDLQVGEIENLSSAPLFINYDQHLIEFVRTEEGDFLQQSGQSTIFTSSPNPGRGELIIGNKQGVASVGGSGSGTLARIYFKATSPGTAVVRPNRVNFRSSAGIRLKTEVEPFQIEIK